MSAALKVPENTVDNCLSSVATLTTEFQTAIGSNISTTAVGPDLHEMYFSS
jgi:hypothetical protein